jgi:hypothetical protein
MNSATGSRRFRSRGRRDIRRRRNGVPIDERRVRHVRVDLRRGRQSQLGSGVLALRRRWLRGARFVVSNGVRIGTRASNRRNPNTVELSRRPGGKIFGGRSSTIAMVRTTAARLDGLARPQRQSVSEFGDGVAFGVSRFHGSRLAFDRRDGLRIPAPRRTTARIPDRNESSNRHSPRV